jgi:hypothetical protein
MLTLYVIPGGTITKASIEKAVEGFLSKEYETEVRVLNIFNYHEMNPDTLWKAFIYSNEFATPEVQEALETFLFVDTWEYYSFYRKAKDEKVSVAPRIFRSDVQLKEDAPYPEDISKLNGTFVLDGWIMEQ